MLTKGLTIAAALVIGLLLAGGAYYWQTGHCPFGCDGSPAAVAPANGDGAKCCGGAEDGAACAGSACTGAEAATCTSGKACAGENGQAAPTTEKKKCCAETACFSPDAPAEAKDKIADKAKTEADMQKKATAGTDKAKSQTNAENAPPK